MSRQWQAFTTRYNVYYNGDEHYKETLKAMETAYEDDYTRFVLTHPADARADSKLPQPSGDFKRTIEKMQKAIQLHSITKKPPKKGSSAKEKAFRARDEFNPFIHNAWLMMGRAQYFNGDFLGAASTFFYITKHFTWLPEVVTEARLWQARSYCALDWDYEAENALHLVKEKQLTTSRLKKLYDLVMADYLVRTGKYEEAVPYITLAAKAAGGSQKNRLYFLLGQVYAHLGKKQLAYEAFNKAGGGMSTAYRTKFNARIKRSEVFTGSNIASEVRSLKSMTRYERNKEFLDQIYYAIGNLYLTRRDTAEAKKNYILAVEKSTRSGIDKALAQLALGGIYFNEQDYVKAQPCYSEAVPLLPKNYPGYETLKRRSDVLDELGVYAGNVQLQDSLLDLSKLSEEEQMKVAERLVEELKKQEKEAAEAAARDEFLANRDQNSLIDQTGSAATPMLGSGDNSWYFYNTMTKNAGKTEFQRKWGARKLEDDWRRRNKSTFALDDETDSDEASEEDEPDSTAPADSTAMARETELAKKESDPHCVEYYLKNIPKTEEQIATCNEIIQEGLYNMGVILKDKLEDYPAACKEFNELDTRYPDNIYRLDAYYNLYLMAVRDDDKHEAEKWRQLIITDFPDSPYGQAMTDPDYFNNLREMHARQEEIYEEAYAAYLDDKNRKVHTLTEKMEKDYPLSPILPKFVFIDALSYLTQGDNDQFRDRLAYLLDKWPDTDMTPMAGAILKGLREGRVPNAGMSNARGMLWDTRLGESGVEGAVTPEGLANFERDPNAPQYLVYAFPRDSVNANQVLYDVARFNFSSFVVKDFDLEPMSFGNVGLLIVKGFANMRELEHYREVMARSSFTLPEAVRPIMISKSNFELLLREGRSFEEYFRFEEQGDIDAKEEEVIGEVLPLDPDGPDNPDAADPDDPDASAIEQALEEALDEFPASEEEESPVEESESSEEEEIPEEP
ncbi:MAG: tetratricopeptide repeat protein [Muribaculaceae bacterium]|nr:tetratricopeptide repeat protein [Muribaculaceae bacterium]